MYCYHCGKKINEKKIETADSTYKQVKDLTIDENTEISYICPRCGHLMTHGTSYEKIKSLSRASHAELQRGRNHYARGMANNILGLILLTTSIIFLLLSKKATINLKSQLMSPSSGFSSDSLLHRLSF